MSEQKEYHIKYKYIERDPSIMVGNCVEYPFIIVKGKNEYELIEQFKVYLWDYFKMCKKVDRPIVEEFKVLKVIV